MQTVQNESRVAGPLGPDFYPQLHWGDVPANFV